MTQIILANGAISAFKDSMGNVMIKDELMLGASKNTWSPNALKTDLTYKQEALLIGGEIAIADVYARKRAATANAALKTDLDAKTDYYARQAAQKAERDKAAAKHKKDYYANRDFADAKMGTSESIRDAYNKRNADAANAALKTDLTSQADDYYANRDAATAQADKRAAAYKKQYEESRDAAAAQADKRAAAYKKQYEVSRDATAAQVDKRAAAYKKQYEVGRDAAAAQADKRAAAYKKDYEAARDAAAANYALKTDLKFGGKIGKITRKDDLVDELAIFRKLIQKKRQAAEDKKAAKIQEMHTFALEQDVEVKDELWGLKRAAKAKKVASMALKDNLTKWLADDSLTCDSAGNCMLED